MSRKMSDYIKHKKYKLPDGRTVTADLISRQAAIDAADNMVEPQESEDKE